MKEWRESFKNRKEYSKNFPFCFYDLAATYLPKDNNSVIIDVGCGSCRFEDYLELWAKYRNLKLLDGNKTTLDKLKLKTEYIFEYKAPNEIPFDNESVDYIFCTHLIEHLDFTQLYKLLKEFNRILKANGIIVISSPLLWENFYNDLDHIKPYNPLIFKSYLCGFESGDLSYNPISEDYKIEELVYRYHTFTNNRISSSINLIDFLIHGCSYILKKCFKIKRYIQTGYTIILRKER